MRWQILAGIGAVESDHAAGSRIAENGDTDPPIVGPLLDGTGEALFTCAFAAPSVFVTHWRVLARDLLRRREP